MANGDSVKCSELSFTFPRGPPESRVLQLCRVWVRSAAGAAEGKGISAAETDPQAMKRGLGGWRGQKGPHVTAG